MSVVVVGGPTISLFPGWSDVRYPIGKWNIDISATGDGSGGTITMNATFHGSSLPPLFVGFSIETCFAQRSNTVDENASLLIGGFSTQGVDGVENPFRGALEMLDAASFGRSVYREFADLFMGCPIRGQNARVIVDFLTNTNADSYRFGATGSLWLYEGMLDMGGVQPLTSSVPLVSGASKPHGSLQQVRSGAVPLAVPGPTQPPIPGQRIVAPAPPPESPPVPAVPVPSQPPIPGQRIVAPSPVAVAMAPGSSQKAGSSSNRRSTPPGVGRTRRGGSAGVATTVRSSVGARAMARQTSARRQIASKSIRARQSIRSGGLQSVTAAATRGSSTRGGREPSAWADDG